MEKWEIEFEKRLELINLEWEGRRASGELHEQAISKLMLQRVYELEDVVLPIVVDYYKEEDYDEVEDIDIDRGGNWHYFDMFASADGE